ncbi:MAG: tRNA dihydrouridine(20/20a) synthase DusA [Pseudomonadales bacterium]|nr:tRNA dihydrouridine(20/20a) synthase DusA [Pseudomonadales bacterium]
MLHYGVHPTNSDSMTYHADPLDRTLSLAPMMGCTDRHCRYLFRLISPHTLMYSEMIVTGALLHGRADHFLQHQDDEPCAVQLGGNEPAALATCARLAEQAGYAEVNLNVGCPSDRVQSGKIGACLMAEPALVADCVRAMQDACTVPVTVKTRIGINDADSYGHFSHFIETVHGAGCRIFIIHARKAVLGGLSPKENREIPPLKYDYLYRIREDFQDTSFVLNGGIKTTAAALELLPGTDGLMLGRAPYADPWLLADLECRLWQQPVPERLEILAQYTDYMRQQMAAGEPLKHMARHLLGFFTGIHGARAFRRHLSTHMFRDTATVDWIDDAVKLSGIDQQARVFGLAL